MHTQLEFPLPDLTMILVEGGEYRMGDETGDLWEACRPVHRVRVDSFYLCQFQVTQRLWQAIMGNNLSRFKGESNPVESVSWEDARDFIKKLNGRGEINHFLATQNIPDYRFRLPTEAEWEYAARGGRYSEGFLYAGSDNPRQAGWFDGNSDKTTHETGLLNDNELGLYDMSGNVWEWCEDWFDEKYYEKFGDEIADNPKGPERGVIRVVRGGSYFNYAVNCRPAYRSRNTPVNRRNDIGFRLALSLNLGGPEALP